jgi:hypothetical protein
MEWEASDLAKEGTYGEAMVDRRQYGGGDPVAGVVRTGAGRQG